MHFLHSVSAIFPRVEEMAGKSIISESTVSARKKAPEKYAGAFLNKINVATLLLVAEHLHHSAARLFDSSGIVPERVVARHVAEQGRVVTES